MQPLTFLGFGTQNVRTSHTTRSGATMITKGKLSTLFWITPLRKTSIVLNAAAVPSRASSVQLTSIKSSGYPLRCNFHAFSIRVLDARVRS